MVDYIADYLTTVRTRRVLPNVKPGYMRPLIEEEAPTHGEPWENIFNDIDRVIMPGVSLLVWTEPTVFFFHTRIDHPLAIAVHARLLSSIELLPVAARSKT